MWQDFRSSTINDWIYVTGLTNSPTDDSEDGHGTCATSKAIGSINGVGRRSSLTPVKLTFTSDKLLQALYVIIDDLPHSRTTPIVVICTISTETPYPQNAGFDPPALWNVVQNVMLDMQKLGVVFVLAVGNKRTRSQTVDTFLALLHAKPEFFPLIVGSTTRKGVSSPWSQELLGVSGSSKMIWAPGEDIVCAQRGG